jgi:hypothetical protein
MENKELFDKLVSLKYDTFTAVYSDDYSAIKRDEARYQDALASQDVFTNEEIDTAARERMAETIRKINERFEAQKKA